MGGEIIRLAFRSDSLQCGNDWERASVGGEHGRLLQWPAGARLGARAVAGVERRECTDSVGVRKECWQDLMML